MPCRCASGTVLIGNVTARREGEVRLPHIPTATASAAPGDGRHAGRGGRATSHGDAGNRRKLRQGGLAQLEDALLQVHCVGQEVEPLKWGIPLRG